MITCGRLGATCAGGTIQLPRCRPSRRSAVNRQQPRTGRYRTQPDFRVSTRAYQSPDYPAVLFGQGVEEHGWGAFALKLKTRFLAGLCDTEHLLRALTRPGHEFQLIRKSEFIAFNTRTTGCLRIPSLPPSHITPPDPFMVPP